MNTKSSPNTSWSSPSPLAPVSVVPYDPNWPTLFSIEAARLRTTLGDNAFCIHHMGSTAIATCFAKPIIDILIEVRSLPEVDSRDADMRKLGYEIMGEYGIAQRRYFRKNSETGVRLFHVHAYPGGDPQVARHLRFRDFMNQSPKWANKYSDLKRDLAKKHPNSSRQYNDGKTDFIQMIDQMIDCDS